MEEVSYKIRKAEQKDLGQLIDLCEAHAHYEQATYERNGKSALLDKALFDKTPKLFCLVVESGQQLIGYATYMIQYSTWDAAEYAYLDCIYLTEASRGMNIGEQLMNRVKEESVKCGCNHIQWQTPDFNTGAIKFYKRIGAFSKSKERFFWAV